MSKLLTVRELAEYLGVSTDWVYTNQARLPVKRLGRHIRFRPEDVQRLLDELKGGQAA